MKATVQCSAEARQHVAELRAEMFRDYPWYRAGDQRRQSDVDSGAAKANLEMILKDHKDGTARVRPAKLLRRIEKAYLFLCDPEPVHADDDNRGARE